jgi:CheY-like chemotaxis protein
MTCILIVEDNTTNMEFTTLLLKKAGYSIVQAENAHCGLQKARLKLPDLILMDIQLPDMSGLDAVVLLKSALETQAIPVIALTALAMKGDEERCLAAGFDAYLSKPLRYKELWTMIKTQLQITR